MWLSLLVGTARFGVWLSRKVLYLLMLLGHGVCCYLLRQMEYDADSYYIKLAGSANFEATCMRFAVLGAAMRNAHKEMVVSWRSKNELPDDFPAFLCHHEANLAPEVRQKIEDKVGFAKTGLFNTHPSDADRIRKAHQSNEPGIFHSNRPARDLFANFEIISRMVTQQHYSDDLGLALSATKLVPLNEDSSNSAELEKEKEPRRIKLAATQN